MRYFFRQAIWTMWFFRRRKVNYEINSLPSRHLIRALRAHLPLKGKALVCLLGCGLRHGFPFLGKLFAFLEDFYFKYPFGIFFSFQFFISFSKTENSFCGRFFFLRCSFASVVRSVLPETSCVMKYFWKTGPQATFLLG